MPPPTKTQKSDLLSSREAVRSGVRESSLGGLISDLSHIEFQMLSKRLAQFEVSGASWYYLRLLWEQDGIIQRELGRRNGVNDASSRTAIQLMERQQLVRREPDQRDGRSIRVFLTTRGKRLKKYLLPIAIELNEVMTRDFSANEIIIFLSLLRRARSNLMQEDARRADSKTGVLAPEA
jgi:DNA-binding MarR family transcriptional regulator